ncbi:DUF2069 domain-containing protein [Rheinheimera tangshanensis]|jgi:uncharacterized membrane protein|uniref:DUF2069 domain-containing protein n=1 Tax=Rheinheimera tangshanensis TaxID=400153 RepID=A0A5C8LXE7_9GAMM|nr:DUF2069 domain-containing protein [Rheinheimera tangshanensis]TXK79750.1 DUF2069 domain-containing protein [Rheinheimera tangshanensis]GGM67361.1 membrane protein [Rheinheimera tangshanensis]
MNDLSVAMAPSTRLYLWLGRIGFVGLFILIPVWVLWLAPPELGSAKVLLALLWTPLWFPLWGMITGKAYTFAWANFIVMLYMVHSLTHLWVSVGTEFFLALLELLFSGLMFVGCTYYARNRGKELGLKIPKLKDDPIRTAKD